MHVEKNVCDNLIRTLLYIKRKMKDGVNSDLDMIEMNIREEFTLKEVSNRTYFLETCLLRPKSILHCNTHHS